MPELEQDGSNETEWVKLTLTQPKFAFEETKRLAELLDWKKGRVVTRGIMVFGKLIDSMSGDRNQKIYIGDREVGDLREITIDDPNILYLVEIDDYPPDDFMSAPE